VTNGLSSISAAEFDRIRVYPNPWRVTLHRNYPVTFDRLPPGSTVKIFTVAPKINGCARAPAQR